jgi:hypothetical protein
MIVKAKVTFAKIVTVTREFEVVVDDDELDEDGDNDMVIYNAAYDRAAQLESQTFSLAVGYRDKLDVADDLKFMSVEAVDEPFEVEVLEEI